MVKIYYWDNYKKRARLVLFLFTSSIYVDIMILDIIGGVSMWWKRLKRRQRFTRKRNLTYLLFLFILLSMGIGYAVLNTTGIFILII